MRRSRWTALALAGAALCANLVALPANAADRATLDVVIDALEPVIPTADGTLRVQGRVANASDVAVEDVTVRLRIGSRPLADQEAVDAVLAAEVEPTNGSPDDVPLDATRLDLAGAIEPGEQRSFRLRIPIAQMRRTMNGVYALGVEARGRDAAGADRRLGAERTLLTLMPSSGQRLGVVWLWPLVDRPARDADGVFLDDGTPKALAPGGRLSMLVRTGAQHRGLVTWIADPALLQSAAQMADGYRVVRGDRVIVGDDPEAGSRWLDDLRRATATDVVHVLPYADIDASASRRAALGTDVIRAATSASPIAEAALERDVEARLAWAPSGRYDKRTSDLLANAGVRTMVLSADALRVSAAAPAVAALGTAVGPVAAVLVDPTLSDILGSPQRTPDEIVQARQRFVARTALLVQASPGDAMVVAAPNDLRWDPSPSLLESLLSATQRAPWLRPTSFDALLDAPRADSTRARYTDGQRDEELPAAYLASVRRSQGGIEQLTGVLDDDLGAAAAYTSALLRAQSAAWRGDQAQARALVRRINAELDARIAQVRVLSTGTVTFSGDAGRVPVTIANDSEATVTLGLALVGRPSTRLISEPLDDITVEPGRKVSVEVPARVLGGEALTVNVQLRTRDGLDYGDPAQIMLTSTAYARAAAWVMGVAFLGIAVFVVIGVTRRIRQARGDDRGHGSGSVTS